MELRASFARHYLAVLWGKIYRDEIFLINTYQKFYLMILGMGDRIVIFSAAK